MMNALSQAGGRRPSSPSVRTTTKVDVKVTTTKTSPAGAKQNAVNVKQNATSPVKPQVLGKSASSEVLGKNLESTGMVRPSNTAAHHIAAGADPRAATARGILKREGIDINDASNGVFLPVNTKNAKAPASTHSTLHTDKYYLEVNKRLSAAKPGQVRVELNKIQSELLNGTFPH
jgi:hypothetical protein